MVKALKIIMGPINASRFRKNKKITIGCKKRLHEDVLEVWRKEKKILSSK